MVRGMKIDRSKTGLDCEICIKGKMTKMSFPKKSERVSEKLEIVHSDLCGPMRVESNGKARYFVTFIDDQSRWCEVRLLKRKDEVFGAFKEYKAFVETQTGRKIKHLQSDNGKEYRNKEFDDFLKSNGIGRRLTVTHTPEQNGVAERKNRTLVEMARCLLIQSGLSPSFWGEAINTANYIRNRCPSSSLDGHTAFEKWTGKIPDVSYFREFGCKIYTLNRNPNKNKFEPQSKKGIFLGYSEQSKAYRVWITEERRVDITRDVKFIEGSSNFPYQNYEDFLYKENCISKQNFMDFPLKSKEKVNENDRQTENFENPDTVNSDNGEEQNDDNENNDNGEQSNGSNDNMEQSNGSNDNMEQSNGNNDDANDQNQDSEDEHFIPENEPKKGPGRPRKIMTGRRGRPKKQYQIVNNAEGKTGEKPMETECVVCLAEITIHEAINGPESNEWLHAMAMELKSIIKNETWTFVDRPKDHKIVGSRIVLRNKYRANGTLEKRKARIVAKGFSQRSGIDFNENFSPVARISSIRTMMALSAKHIMRVKQFDVTTAYLNGILDEKIFMEIPEYTRETLEEIIRTDGKYNEIGKKAKRMLTDLSNENKVCYLKKALWGLRQAGRQWHAKLSEELKKFELTPSNADPCIFYSGQGEEILLIAVYIDDILVASRNEKMIDKFSEHLSKIFEIKSLRDVKNCLGIEFTQNKQGIMMSQRGYICDMLNRFGMSDSRPVATPIDISTKLKQSKNQTNDTEEKIPYRELIGSLMYLAVCKRPDISHAVSYLSQYNSCYDSSHWTAAKRVLRYLKGSSELGLFF